MRVEGWGVGRCARHAQWCGLHEIKGRCHAIHDNSMLNENKRRHVIYTNSNNERTLTFFTSLQQPKSSALVPK